MIGWTWLNPVLALAAIGVGGYFAVRGVRGRPHDRLTCWTHGLMALAMAPMFWPWGDPLPPAVGAVVFAVVGAWFAAARLRQGPGAPGDPLHVAVGCGAMVVMYLGMPAEHGPGTAGHAGHAATGTGAAGLLLVAVGLALTGYFAWHAWSTAAPADATTSSATPSATGTTTAVAARSRITTETAAHIVLDALMAIMFLGAL